MVRGEFLEFQKLQLLNFHWKIVHTYLEQLVILGARQPIKTPPPPPIPTEPPITIYNRLLPINSRKMPTAVVENGFSWSHSAAGGAEMANNNKKTCGSGGGWRRKSKKSTHNYMFWRRLAAKSKKIEENRMSLAADGGKNEKNIGKTCVFGGKRRRIYVFPQKPAVQSHFFKNGGSGGAAATGFFTS